MAVKYDLYRPKPIPNRCKHLDHWFWMRHSAHAYMGCQHDCEDCYWRESKYCPYPDREDFLRLIKVKINALRLWRKELSRVPVDAIGLGDSADPKLLQGDSQMRLPARRVPLSPLPSNAPGLPRPWLSSLCAGEDGLQDLELIKAVNDKARAVVSFSSIFVLVESYQIAAFEILVQ